jgi:predicted hydrocarbon binding protein
MTDKTTPRGSSNIGEILLLGVEEIIGSSGVNAILNLAQLQPGRGIAVQGEPLKRMDNVKIAAAQLALETMYGPRGGRGIALRAGRAGFKYLLRQYGIRAGLVDLNFRLLPVPSRLKSGLEMLAGLMGQIGDERVLVEDQEKHWVWNSLDCPICWERTSREQVCHFTVGLLQEFSAWASGGRVFAVAETSCRAKGDPGCQIQIEKRPLD